MTFRKFIAIAALCIGSTAAIADGNSLNINALLKSISEVESNNHFWKIGRNGERSEYQITRGIWQKYSSIPFWKASGEEYRYESQRVAKKFIGEIIEDIVQDGFNVTAKNIALRWNGGVNQTHFQRRSITYATNVSNLYETCKNSVIEENRPRTKLIKSVSIKIVIDVAELEDQPVVPANPKRPLYNFDTNESGPIFMGYDYSRRVSPWRFDFDWIGGYNFFHLPPALSKIHSISDPSINYAR